MTSRAATGGWGLLLAAGLHADWHLARPLHHRLSLAWPGHWVATAALFALVGWWIARRWTDRRWRMALDVLVIALVVAQVIEPSLEVLVYEHRLGYPVEPERWRVLARTLAAALPAYAVALWMCAPRPAARVAA